MVDPVAVVFDLDGTLIHSAPEIHAIVNQAMTAEGLPPLTAAQVQSFVGNGVGVLVARCLAAQGLPTDGDLHLRMVARFVAQYETQFSRTTLYPGVMAMLQTLAKRGHPMGICTNKSIGPTRAVLAHFELLGYFPVIIGGDSLPQRKPDPAPLRHTITLMGGMPAVFIGDSEVDAETAHATPLPFGLFTGGYRTASVTDLSPDITFDHHSALPDLLR
jgi:phosphoglycolate phosphatase